MDDHSQDHPLATESFSYSWLTNPEQKPNYPLIIEEDHLQDDEDKSNNHKPPSSSTQTFNFDISNYSSFSSSHHQWQHHPLVHADQLFSNGIILPSDPITTTPPSPTTAFSPVVFNQTQIITRQPLRKNRSLRRFYCRNLMRKFLGCLRLQTPGGGGTRVADFSRREQEVVNNMKTFSNRRSDEDDVMLSDRDTPSPSTKAPRLTGSRSSDYDESWILEAILYCKRSSAGIY